jgi:protein-S-isoprenylcysteine O-methyltransferase Ste14
MRTPVHPTNPSTTIVATGPFRFSRNPMYLSLCVWNLSYGFILCDAGVILLTIPLALVFQLGLILPEERYLEGRFGSAYIEYRNRVRRWF